MGERNDIIMLVWMEWVLKGTWCQGGEEVRLRQEKTADVVVNTLV